MDALRDRAYVRAVLAACLVLHLSASQELASTPPHITSPSVFNDQSGCSRWIDPIACTSCCAPLELTPPAASLSFGAVSLAPGVFRGLCAAMG